MKLLLSIFLFSIYVLSAQPNCNAYKIEGNRARHTACKKTEEARNMYQFRKEYIEIMDEAIEIDPTFSYPYWAKSIAFLKSGDFITWKEIIDKAVELKPEQHLGYRGWCRYQFFRDYEGAIADIEKLDSLVDHEIGFTQNGDYHLNVAKALCYKAIGRKEKAIEIMEKQMARKDHFLGAFDYFHLGVLYFEKGLIAEALTAFEKQNEENPLAENYYYWAMANKASSNIKACKAKLIKGLDLYKSERNLSDNYTHHADKIFLSDIEKEIRALEK